MMKPPFLLFLIRKSKQKEFFNSLCGCCVPEASATATWLSDVPIVANLRTPSHRFSLQLPWVSYIFVRLTIDAGRKRTRIRRIRVLFRGYFVQFSSKSPGEIDRLCLCLKTACFLCRSSAAQKPSRPGTVSAKDSRKRMFQEGCR